MICCTWPGLGSMLSYGNESFCHGSFSKPSQFCYLPCCRPVRSQASMPLCRLSFVKWTDLDQVRLSSWRQDHDAQRRVSSSSSVGKAAVKLTCYCSLSSADLLIARPELKPNCPSPGQAPGECRNELLLLAANFRVSPLLSLQLSTSQELRLSGHNLPLGWQKRSGSGIAPKTLNSWASMWTIRVEPEREMAQCPAMLCHDSHPRSGQHSACDSKACSRQDAEASWGWWPCSSMAPGGDP